MGKVAIITFISYNIIMKYIIHIGICGFGNQLLGFKELCIISKYLNRKIILPIFIPHGTIRADCKKFYEFKEVFDVEHFKKFYDCDLFENIKNIKINKVYNIRSSNEDNSTVPYFNYQRNYYNIEEDIEKVYLKKKFITSIDDINELKTIDDDVLVLIGTFNTLKLSTCMKNGCLNKNCKMNETFKEEYYYSVSSLIHNAYIKDSCNKFLKEKNLNDYVAFHLRTSDLIGNNPFHKIYNDLLEETVFESIENYLIECNLLNKNIFLAAPPDAFKIKGTTIINSNKIIKMDYSITNDLFLNAIVESEILKNSNILIYSPTNTPHEKKTHTRSSFILQIRDQRMLQNLDMYDKCISDIYNNTVKLTQININKNTEKKIISFSLYNDKDIYNYGLLLNYELKKHIYKDWIMRVYVNNTVNKNLLNYIKKNLKDIELIIVESIISPMYYRFFPQNDKNVKYFITRDLDSIIGFKEEEMVNEWIESNKKLHLIHEVYPGHRHLIMAGMFGYRNDFYNKIDSNIIEKNTIFNYSPFGGDCIADFNNNNDLIISRIGCASKKLNISKDTINSFYNNELIQAKWMNNININCKLETNGNILVQPLGPNNNFYFEKKIQYTSYQEIDSQSIINNIYNYHKKLNRNNYIYLDEQNWLSEYFKSLLTKDSCLDHNNMSQKRWDYSTKFNKHYKKLDTLYYGLNEGFVGHRVDTKNLYKKFFNFFDIENNNY